MSNGGRENKRTAAIGAGGQRRMKVRVKKAKGLKLSSKLWLERQLNDPFVEAAKMQGLRSRAAFKLMQIDDKYGFLKPGKRVVDLGSAPGGWSQVAADRVKAVAKRGAVVALDLTDVEAIPGVKFLQADFMEPEAPDLLLGELKGEGADVVLSDMAAQTTGHRQTDHIRIMALAEAAAEFAAQVLTPGGCFLAKVLQGGTERELLLTLRRDYAKVHHVKPTASRAGSAELYVLATGFRGGKEEAGEA